MRFLKYLKFELTYVLRQPGQLALSILLPLGFFMLFTSMQSDFPNEDAKQAFMTEMMYSMTAFSVMSYALFTFPLEFIRERKINWHRFIAKSPLTWSDYYLVKGLKLFMLNILSIIVIFSFGIIAKGIEVDILTLIISIILLLFGSINFIIFGSVLAQFNNEQSVSIVANLIYIGLAVLGGIWWPVRLFPDWLQSISQFMPSYHLKHLSFNYYQNHEITFNSIIILLAYSIIGCIIVLLITNRKEVQHQG